MSRFTRTAALATVGALLAVPTAVLAASPASAETDVDRNGVCGGGRYEFSVDREDGGYEVSVDLDNVAPGSRWKVVMRQDGNTFFSRTLTADNEGDLDVDRNRANRSGNDTFKFRATRADRSASCSRTITVG
jgi:hypothetical protein